MFLSPTRRPKRHLGRAAHIVLRHTIGISIGQLPRLDSCSMSFLPSPCLWPSPGHYLDQGVMLGAVAYSLCIQLSKANSRPLKGSTTSHQLPVLLFTS